jgi:hypothetical protein
MKRPAALADLSFIESGLACLAGPNQAEPHLAEPNLTETDRTAPARLALPRQRLAT